MCALGSRVVDLRQAAASCGNVPAHWAFDLIYRTEWGVDG